MRLIVVPLFILALHIPSAAFCQPTVFTVDLSVPGDPRCLSPGSPATITAKHSKANAVGYTWTVFTTKGFPTGQAKQVLPSPIPPSTPLPKTPTITFSIAPTCSGLSVLPQACGNGPYFAEVKALYYGPGGTFTVSRKSDILNLRFANAAANFSLNGSTAANVTIPEGQPIIMDGTSSVCARAYFISVQLSDPSWNRYGPEAMRWLSASEAQDIGHFEIRKFAKDHGVEMKPDKYYRVKLAVSDPWNESSKLVYIAPYQAGPREVMLRHQRSGKCIYGNPVENGVVHNWGCWNDPNMAFLVEKVVGNEVRLRHKKTGKCLVGAPTNGGQVKNRTCSNDPGLVYVLDPAGNGVRLRHKATGKCVYGSTQDGGAVHNWGCFNHPYMVYSLDPY